MPQAARTSSTTAARTASKTHPGSPLRPDVALFDRAQLDRNTMGDADLARELLTLYAEQAPRLMADLAAARDGRALREVTHRLSGAARAVGAQAVAAAAGELEAELMRRDFARGFPGEADMIARLSDAVARTQVAFAGLARS